MTPERALTIAILLVIFIVLILFAMRIA